MAMLPDIEKCFAAYEVYPRRDNCLYRVIIEQPTECSTVLLNYAKMLRYPGSKLCLDDGR